MYCDELIGNDYFIDIISYKSGTTYNGYQFETITVLCRLTTFYTRSK